MRSTPSTDIERLENALGVNWHHLRAAKTRSESKRTEVQRALAGLDSDDTSIVISGSLARNEFTSGSDIDWTLLVDGSADPKHHDLYRRIDALIRPLAVKPPGEEGTFGAMVFSHELIHAIGGDEDTNQNTTRRALLLLESCATGRQEAYDRVVRNILNRYLLEDRGFWHGSEPLVPRFLQNDLARFWRTMAVDFAYKLRRRSSEKWAIRNIKLRMSRKLIYVSGLLLCYRCHAFIGDGAASLDSKEIVIEYLQTAFSVLTPLEILAGTLLHHTHLQNSARKLFDSYDAFVGILADENKRKHLEDLKEDDADSDSVYQEARSLSHTFRDGLTELFFDTESGMDVLTKKYGVF